MAFQSPLQFGYTRQRRKTMWIVYIPHFTITKKINCELFCLKFFNTALSFGAGQWDVRRIVLSGNQAEFDRYVTYGYERCVYNLRRVSDESGKNFFSGYLLMNMAGYNTRIHGCLACKHFDSLYVLSLDLNCISL